MRALSGLAIGDSDRAALPAAGSGTKRIEGTDHRHLDRDDHRGGKAGTALDDHRRRPLDRSDLTGPDQSAGGAIAPFADPGGDDVPPGVRAALDRPGQRYGIAAETARSGLRGDHDLPPDIPT